MSDATTSNTMRCEDALRLLAQYLDRELADTDQDEVERHLSTCRSCYSRAEFEKRLREQVAMLGRIPVPTEFEERVRAIIGQFALRPEPAPSEG